MTLITVTTIIASINSLNLKKACTEFFSSLKSYDEEMTASTTVEKALVIFLSLAMSLVFTNSSALSQMTIHFIKINTFDQLIFNLNQITIEIDNTIRFIFCFFNYSLMQLSLNNSCNSNNQFHSEF